MPELTKKFFEKILRESEKNDELQVTKVKVSDENEFGKHFCSQVNSLEVHVKTKDEMKIRRPQLTVAGPLLLSAFVHNIRLCMVE